MKKSIIVLGILILTAVMAYPVFGQGPGWGRGGHMMGDWNRGGQMMGDWNRGGQMMGNRGRGPGSMGMPGRGYGNMTEDQAKQLDGLDRKFYDETADLRSQMWAKSGELNVEMNRSNPDPDKVKAVQGEVNDLRGKLSEKRIDYELEVRKINPDSRYGMGYGHRMGGYRPGACWN